MKKVVIGFVISFSLVCSPLAAVAATNSDTVSRAVALELIEKLLEQIALLQKQLDAINAYETLLATDLPDSRYDIVAAYQIANSSAVDQIADPVYRNYFARVLELLPREYEDRIGEFVVFVDADNQVDSYVETMSNEPGKWLYGVSQDVIDEPETNADTELIVHEFGHIISYDQIVGVPEPSNTTCDRYFQLTGCPLESSFLSRFVDRFWSTKNLTRATDIAKGGDPIRLAHDYYKEHESNFVSDYAALNPEEDFAESFADFVLEDAPAHSSIKDQKVQFFYRYPELVALRTEIRWSR